MTKKKNIKNVRLNSKTDENIHSVVIKVFEFGQLP